MSDTEKKTKRMLTLSISSGTLKAADAGVPVAFLTENFTENGLQQPIGQPSTGKALIETVSDSEPESEFVRKKRSKPASPPQKKMKKKSNSSFARRFVDTEAAHDSEGGEDGQGGLDEPTLSDIDFVVPDDEEDEEEGGNSDTGSQSPLDRKRRKKSSSSLSLYRRLDNEQAKRGEREHSAFSLPRSSQSRQRKSGPRSAPKTARAANKKKSAAPAPVASKAPTPLVSRPVVTSTSQTRKPRPRLLAEVENEAQAERLNALPLQLLHYLTTIERCLSEMAPFQEKLKLAVENHYSGIVTAANPADVDIRMDPKVLGAVLDFCNIGGMMRTEILRRGLARATANTTHQNPKTLFECIWLHEPAALSALVTHTLRLLEASVKSVSLDSADERFLKEQAEHFLTAYETLSSEVQKTYGGFQARASSPQFLSFMA